jgi:hypothetical protein
MADEARPIGTHLGEPRSAIVAGRSQRTSHMRTRSPLTLVPVAALLLAGCGTSAAPTVRPPGDPQPLVIDLDMDSSDVMALGYALHVPGYEVVGITVSGTGIGSCPTGARSPRFRTSLTS